MSSKSPSESGARPSELFEAAGNGHTILAPNTELATALADTVERLHVAAGHAIWPTPRIRDFGGWLRERYAQRQLDAALPRLLNDIEERELWREVILASDLGKAFLEPQGAARAARRARRAMAEYGIPQRALAAYATEESLALLDWNRGFEERCRALNCISADQLPSPEEPSALAWIESPQWRPVARRWLSTRGVLLRPAQSAAAAPRRVRVESPAGELAAMAEWARENLRASANFRAWICIPDLSLRRSDVHDAFDAALAPQRLSLSAQEVRAAYAVAGGTPLSDYAPVRAALRVLAATVAPVSFDDFSALLRMPELQASAADAGAAAALDVALRTRAPSEADLTAWLNLAERVAEGSVAAAAAVVYGVDLGVGVARPGVGGSGAARPRVGALQRLRQVLQTLEAVSGRQPLSRWASIWVDAFECGPWAHRHRWSSTEFQAAERFRELLGQMATADHLLGARTAASAGRILQRAARDTVFQVQTGIPPVWISGQLMDPWLTYDGLWVAGCSEERWPPPLDPIPLLPVRLQRDYGVIGASAETQLQFAEDLQHRWRSRARSAVFSCADPGDGRSSAFSPLLPAAPPEVLAPLVPPHWHALRVVPRFESLRDERAPDFAPAERTRGVATLRAQSQCAFRGFAQTRLSTEPLERPVPGFTQRERGNMLHHALEQIWSELRSWAELKAAADERLRELIGRSVTRAIARQCAHRDPGLRWQQREAPRLCELIAEWLRTEALREPFDVEFLEHGAQPARHGGLEFKVRIDRIDRLADGGRVLIDYKTGMATADWRGDRPDNPQLPVYALLKPDALVAVAYGRVNASECCFVAETARAGIFKPRGRPSNLEGLPSFVELIATWSRRIEKLALEFAHGHAEVAPTLRACASCSLQPLCRVPGALEGADTAYVANGTNGEFGTYGGGTDG